ncbi:hypothetical protein NKJ95_32015 [Mesorhizobium sp. M0012]|uniref:hypothetical protein n=1 Tax=Mesorhizobium sp. M0012 TaxID=2956840 RepID=UPI00333B8876
MVYRLDLRSCACGFSYVQPHGHHHGRAHAAGDRRSAGDPLASGFYGRFAIAFVVAVIFCLNIVLIGFAPLKMQIGVVWFELLLLFLAFFDSFDLSLPFIWKNLPFLITQGVADDDLCCGAFANIFASLIAIVAAIAKLS